jgi:hypothetical protein
MGDIQVTACCVCCEAVDTDSGIMVRAGDYIHKWCVPQYKEHLTDLRYECKCGEMFTKSQGLITSDGFICDFCLHEERWDVEKIDYMGFA